MKQNYRLLVVLVATMVCNGSCRPQRIDGTDIFPVYKSEKQVDGDAINRYEKLNAGDDSVSLTRIDIPRMTDKNIKKPVKYNYKIYPNSNNNKNNKTDNNKKKIINYVPVAITVKKTSSKKWPSDQNGIQTAEDLSFYNIYTQDIKPFPTENQKPHYQVIPNSKPSIVILEDVTTHKPFPDHSDDYTDTVHALDPPYRPPESFPVNEIPNQQYTPENTYQETFRPTSKPVYVTDPPIHNTENVFVRPIHMQVYYEPHPPNEIQINRPQNTIENEPYPQPQPPYLQNEMQVYRPQYTIQSEHYPEFPHPQNEMYTHRPQNTIDNDPYPHPQPPYTQNEVHMRPPQNTIQNEPYPELPQPIHDPIPEVPDIVTTIKPEVTTKKRKKNKCPNISIISINNITNQNFLGKEACPDINIQIVTTVNNTNMVPTKSGSETSGIAPQSDTPSSDVDFSSVFDVISTILTRVFSLSLISSIFTGFFGPFSALITGKLSIFGVLLSYLFGSSMFDDNRKRALTNFKVPTRGIVKRDYSNVYFMQGEKRRKRNIDANTLPYSSWTRNRKISSFGGPSVVTAAPKLDSDNKNVKETTISIDSIATVARASSSGPSAPSSAAIGQLIDAVSQMVDSDTRTPPKLKEIIKEKTTDRRDALGEGFKPMPVTFVYEDEEVKPVKADKIEEADKVLMVDQSQERGASNGNLQIVMTDAGKGIAIPVVMEDAVPETTRKMQKIAEVTKPPKDEKKKTSVSKSQTTTTPSSGLSTWILLSDYRDSTTSSPKKSHKKDDGDDKIRTTAGSSTKKPIKIQTPPLKYTTTQAVKKTTAKPNNVSTKKPDEETSATSVLEGMVKNQKKSSSTTPKPKISESRVNNSKKPGADSKKKQGNGQSQEKTEILESKTANTLPVNLILPTESSIVSGSEEVESSSESNSTIETTTKKKKTSNGKKKKKNKKKKKTETGIEAKNPEQAVSSQIYSFLSREIMPTVGLGLIGVALTAGLASFLGYNPFGSTTVPLRRTYESNHGYTPNNYYNYNSDYGDGGQSEEVLFREVLSGMPEGSRYRISQGNSGYQENYKRQDQIYDSNKTPVYSVPQSNNKYVSEKNTGGANYDSSNYPQDYSYSSNYDAAEDKYTNDYKEKFPVYTRETGTSFVYPETTGLTSADKALGNDDRSSQNVNNEKYGSNKAETIERQPEALYRVASESDLQYRNGESTIQGTNSQSSWHRIGAPSDAVKYYPALEPGPRSLDLSKLEKEVMKQKSRSKRAADSVIQRIARKRTNKQSDNENEVDFDDPISDQKVEEQVSEELTTTTAAPTTTSTEIQEVSSTTLGEEKEAMTTTTEEIKDGDLTESDSADDQVIEPVSPGSSASSVMEVLRRLAEFKLKLGLNFLRSTTDLFSKYLNDIQKRVDETFPNTTSVQYNRRKSPWSTLLFGAGSENQTRQKRSALEESPLLASLLSEESKLSERFSKSTKKDLKPSNKIFHQKKTVPKKYQSKNGL